nr:uncharacterized protein LOC126520749 [Dermacentor andersoni]
MERVVPNRLNRYLEDNEVYRYNIIGFRAGLIVNNRSREVKALLGLDLEKAFDNVLHTFVIKTISDLGLGSRFHSYVSSFLTDRNAKLRVRDFRSEDVSLGARGTSSERKSSTGVSSSPPHCLTSV